MKLTRKQSICRSIELWTDLAETGIDKGEWDGWEKYGNDIWGDCFLCEYATYRAGASKGACKHCPYYQKFGYCQEDEKPTYYDKWESAKTKRTRKKYAKLFLEQLKQLK